jgi:hypothetical protein
MLTDQERAYCRADKADPFNVLRIETHKRVGIAAADDYSARETVETHNGVQHVAWRDRKRP